MPKIAYIDKNFRDDTRLMIQQANAIIGEYSDDGLSLTLRQLYYQFVARGMIANKQSEYKKLGSIISDARLAGLVDWLAIEDRTRNLEENSHWTDPGSIIRSAAAHFQVDHWEGQDYRVEVWIEKEALIGVIDQICQELDVPYFACKGYVSQSEMWRAGRRLSGYDRQGQRPVIIHLGDHDPSGIDMTRDIFDRVDMFSSGIDMERIALTMNQVEDYDPPPNPAKLTDTRSSDYVAKYGDSSWELDALEPRVLRDLIAETVKGYRDEDTYLTVLDKEMEYKEILKRVEENWETL